MMIKIDLLENIKHNWILFDNISEVNFSFHDKGKETMDDVWGNTRAIFDNEFPCGCKKKDEHCDRCGTSYKASDLAPPHFLFIVVRNGNDESYAVQCGYPVYIMNDEGKTVEKFY